MLADNISLDLGRASANRGAEICKVGALPKSTFVGLIVVHKKGALRTLHVGPHHFQTPSVFRMTILIGERNTERVIGIERRNGRSSIADRIGFCLNSQLDELVANHRILQNGRAVPLEVLHGVHQIFETNRLHRVRTRLPCDNTALVFECFHGHAPTTTLVAE